MSSTLYYAEWCRLFAKRLWMPADLGYFTIPVADVDRERLFYESLFGWAFDAGADARYAHVGNSTVPFGLVRGEPQALDNLYFRVASIDALLPRVIELGGSAEAATASSSGRSAVCRDAGGTAFSIWEPAPGY